MCVAIQKNIAERGKPELNSTKAFQVMPTMQSQRRKRENNKLKLCTNPFTTSVSHTRTIKIEDLWEDRKMQAEVL